MRRKLGDVDPTNMNNGTTGAALTVDVSSFQYSISTMTPTMSSAASTAAAAATTAATCSLFAEMNDMDSSKTPCSRTSTKRTMMMNDDYDEEDSITKITNVRRKRRKTITDAFKSFSISPKVVVGVNNENNNVTTSSSGDSFSSGSSRRPRRRRRAGRRIQKKDNNNMNEGNKQFSFAEAGNMQDIDSNNDDMSDNSYDTNENPKKMTEIHDTDTDEATGIDPLLISEKERAERAVMYELVFGKKKPVESQIEKIIRKSIREAINPSTTIESKDTATTMDL